MDDENENNVMAMGKAMLAFCSGRRCWCLLNLPNGMNRSTRHGESLLIRIFISLMFDVCAFSLNITVGSVLARFYHHTFRLNAE